MRGEAVGGPDALGGGPATRSLLALDMDSRMSRTSGGGGGHEAPMSAGARSMGRPGSGLGRPNSRLDGGMGATGQLRVPGGGSNVGIGLGAGSAGVGSGGNLSSSGLAGGGAGAGGLGEAKGHKSRHSLVGKFTSGMRGAGSRDREKDKGSARK
jgi:hypothetical protein